MASTEITVSDVSTLRSAQSFTKSLSVHITPLTTVQSGTITALPATYPTIQVTWDGSSTGVSAGQLFRITSGSTHKAWGVIRKAPSGAILYINETPLGASGYATDIENAIAVSDTITIFSHRPLWTLHSRIANKTFFKFWDVSPGTDLTNVPPLANTGTWQSGNIASGDTTAAFTLPRAGTNTSIIMAGTLSAYLWTLPTGVTLQSGYATSDAVIEVDAEAGYHQISLRVTDSNGKTHTAYMWLFVSDGADGTSLSERYVIPSVQLQQTRKGFTGSLEIIGTDLQDVLYPGAGLLIKETPYFSDGTLTDGVFVDSFIAYIVDIQYTYDTDRIPRATVTFESPVIYANRINQPVQSMTEVTSPANWAQVTSALSNPRGAFYYAAKWHTPALLDMHDVSATSMTTPRRKFIDFNTNTLGAAIDHVAKLFLINIGSAADGTTVLSRYPQYMSNSDRNAVDVRITWLAQDLRLPLSYRLNMLEKPSEVRTGAFAYNGSKTGAWLAGKLWNQGVGSSELANFTVTMAEGITRVKEVAGHYYAEQASDIKEFSSTLLSNMDVIDPAWMIWDRLTISSAYDPHGRGWTNARLIPNSVNRNWQSTASGIEKSIAVSWQPETFGQPGTELPIGNVKTSTGKVQAVPFTPLAGESFGAVGVMLAVNDTGNLAVTYDYLADSPVWTDLSERFAGSVNDFDWDYNSTFFTGGFLATGSIGVYVVTVDGTDFNVYRIPDIKNPSSVPELLETATMNDSSVNYNGRIKCSEQTPTLVLAAWKDQTGTEFIRSTDGGATWSAKANVGSAITDTDNDDAALGLDIYNVTQVISAPNATSEYGLYKATTASGSFSEVTNTERKAAPQPLVKFYDTTAVYTAIAATGDTPTTDTVDFDGGYAYTIVDVTNSSATVDTGGNPSNCAKESGTFGGGQDVEYYVSIDLGASVPVTDFTFGVYQHNHSPAGGGTYVSTVIYVRFYDGGVQQAYIRYGTGGNVIYRDTWLACSVDILANTSHLISAWVVSPGLTINGSDPLSYPSGITCDEIRVVMTTVGSSDTDDWDWRLDNLAVTYGVAGDTPALYRVTSLTGSSSWTDVSPDTDAAPVRPHDLAIDIADSDVVHTVANDDTWYSSANGGTAWSTEESATDKRTPLVVGDAIAFGGVSEVQVSLNSGTTFDDKNGNLATLWTIGTIKKVAAL